MLPHSAQTLADYAPLGDAPQPPSWLARNRRKVIYILVYYVLAVTVAMFNKHVIGGGTMSFPLMLSACSAVIQTALAAGSLAVLGVLGKTITGKLTLAQYCGAVVPCALASGLDIGISNSSLQFVSLSFYTMVKSSAPVFVLASALVLGLERPSAWLFVVMAVIAVGTLMTVWSPDGVNGFDVHGFLMVLSAAMLSGVRWSLTQLIIEEHGDSDSITRSSRKLTSAGPLATILYLAPIAGALMFVMSAVVEGVGRFAVFFSLHKLYTVAVFLLSGVLTFFLILTEYKVVQETSVLTFAITGILKEIILIALSMAVFGDRLIAINYVGIVVSIGGIAAYNWLRMRLSHSRHHQHSKLKPIVVEPLQSFVTDSSGDNMVLPTDTADALLDTLVRDDHHGHLNHMTTAEKVKTRLSSYLSPFAPQPSVEALGT